MHTKEKPTRVTRSTALNGPLSFTLYTAPLEDIINAHSLGRMIYADDKQVFIVLDIAKHSSLIPNIEKCISDINGLQTGKNEKVDSLLVTAIKFIGRKRLV